MEALRGNLERWVGARQARDEGPANEPLTTANTIGIESLFPVGAPPTWTCHRRKGQSGRSPTTSVANFRMHSTSRWPHR